MAMDELVPVILIHFYDIRHRETLCGLRGFAHRSTKRARGVTCPKCVGLLHQRQGQEAVPDPDGSSNSAASV
jgi:hypothetical protein